MNEFLNVYNVELKAEGPVYIGSGGEIGKKEYAFFSKTKRVCVMDTAKLSKLLSKKGLISEYERFMLGNSKEDVGKWLEKQNVSKAEYSPCFQYELDCGDAVLDTHSKLSIMKFVRDAYGSPYVPGSSIKGMLRTILLAYDMEKNPSRYASVKKCIPGFRNGNSTINKNTYLKKDSTNLESACFNTLKRPDTKEGDAVNDWMSGIIVGDSEPLSVDDLIVCQRTELHVDGREKRLNVLREALRPGTIIKFLLTIDSAICPVTVEDIRKAIEYFGEMYYHCFLSKYHFCDKPESDSVWLGGGSGFVTKTEIYPMFGEQKGKDIAADIFDRLDVSGKHKHYLDKRMGVSPHICKVTYYNKKRYQMGICRIKISGQGAFSADACK